MFLHNFPRINPKFTFPTFFLTFQEISWKYSKQFHKIISKYLENVLKISNISPKSASIQKYVFKTHLLFIFSQNFSKDEILRGHAEK